MDSKEEKGRSSRVTNKASKRPVVRHSATDERQAAAMGKIAKGFRRLNVEARPRGPQFLAVLLCFLGLVLVGYKIFQPRLGRGNAEAIATVDQRPEPEVSQVLVRSEEHQSAIEAFESALFGNATGGDLTMVITSIVERGAALARELQGSRGPGPRSAADSLLGLMEKLEDASQGLPLDRVAATRRSWVNLRGQLFEPAEFFQVPGPDNAVDPLEVAGWRTSLDDLERTVTTAADQAALLAGELRNNLDEQVRANARRSLDETRVELVRQLGEIGRGTPPQPTGKSLPTAMMEGIQAYRTALTLAARLAGSEAELTQAGGTFEAFKQQIEIAQRSFGEI